MENFEGKVAAVTGGASGIGRSLVKELLAAGAKVVIGDVEQAALDRVIAEFAAAGEISGVVADVSDPASVNAFADGHVKYWKWEDQTYTVDAALESLSDETNTGWFGMLHSYDSGQATNPDLHRMIRATWGDVDF
jgi:NAD(P)-dependent dehydrogenase (short-subunit alcohol dehydrogenase family)